jgi:hypothetical protein
MRVVPIELNISALSDLQIIFADVSATFISCTLFHSYPLQIFRSEAFSTWTWTNNHFQLVRLY